MASRLLTKYITWSKSCQSLRSLESLNRALHVHIVTWHPHLIGQVCCSQLRCGPYLAANFGFFELRTFLCMVTMQSLSRCILPLDTQSRFQVPLQHYTCITLFLYISLPSLRDYDVIVPYFTFC